MKIVFWQNIISPHQSFLIRELSYRHNVILAVLEEITDDRIEQGWKRPDTGTAKIFFLETKNVAFKLLYNNKDAIHVFSGIGSYKIISDVFRKLDKNAIIGVIVESGSPLEWKSAFRKPLYALKCLRFNYKIDFIFAMGDLGVKWFDSVGFPKEKIHKFQYFTELPNISCFKDRQSCSIPKLLFIGLLNDRKNIEGLLDALVNLKEMHWTLDIIGDGPLRDSLKRTVIDNNLNEKVVFHGNMDNEVAMNILSASDYLILPSNFDGWGAVVNEALSRGVKVITNVNCGASCLVKEMNWGIVYKNNSKKRLEKALIVAISNFKQESLAARKLVATEFVDNYSMKIVDKFEQILLSK